MSVYAESSAVVAWLLGEPAGAEARRHLAQAELILASDLTVVECERVLVRATVTGRIEEADASDRRAHLARAASGWHRLRMNGEVVERAGRSFPIEPIRTLDALHLASLVVAGSAVPGLRLLSLDDRVRACGEGMGFEVVPA